MNSDAEASDRRASYDRWVDLTSFHPNLDSREPTVMTVFAKILAGEIPCHRVYEDEHVLAFLDVAPLSPGHVLLIPREARPTLGELSDEAGAALGRVLPRLCRAVCAATGASAYNVLQNNGSEAHQAVMHVHFHIIPRLDGQGLGLEWSTLDPGDDAARLAEKISAAVDP
jgi:histidine triad (HIT) family protein